MTNHSTYVLITPAKNEERLIGITIESVQNQTILPAEWIIVSDGSTDKTDDIVRSASLVSPWIKLLPLPPRTDRNFAAVVQATEAGVRSLKTNSYAYIGLLDSDVRLQTNYFEKVIREFEVSPNLGLAGGVAIDIGLRKDHLPRNRQDVPGALQFFKRKCFENLGGLLAIPEGGWDALTCARARMLGYETRLITSLVVDHLKPRNIAEGGIFRRHKQLGIRDYALGYTPLFEFLKCMVRAFQPPIVIGAASWWIGFCSASFQKRKRHIPPELLKHVREEQKQRLMELITRSKKKRFSRPRPGMEQ